MNVTSPLNLRSDVCVPQYVHILFFSTFGHTTGCFTVIGEVAIKLGYVFCNSARFENSLLKLVHDIELRI